jgi:hypothetical protein
MNAGILILAAVITIGIGGRNHPAVHGQSNPMIRMGSMLPLLEDQAIMLMLSWTHISPR